MPTVLGPAEYGKCCMRCWRWRESAGFADKETDGHCTVSDRE